MSEYKGVTRKVYREAKKFDHQQFNAFCAAVYKEGYKDGRASVPGAEYSDVIKAVRSVDGVSEALACDIEAAVEALFCDNGVS